MGHIKESFKDQFLQQRLNSFRPKWTPRNLKIIFTVLGVLYLLLSVPLLIVAGTAYDQTIIYDGYDQTGSDCHISKNNQNKECTVSFTLTKDVTNKLSVFYELDNFYQNHREYVNSVNWNQIHGDEVNVSDLQSDCGSKTFVDETKAKILVPCGYIANSFFNDVIHLNHPSLIINEHDISYKRDRDRFINYPNYDKPSSTYQYIYETYNQIPKDKSNKMTDSNYYGGGVQDEHFIVWMRLAGVPRFRKLYGRIEHHGLKKGDILEFKIQSNFEVSSYQGRKALVLTTDNFVGGRNFGIGILFVVGGILSFVFVIGILVVQKICPDMLPINGGKYD